MGVALVKIIAHEPTRGASHNAMHPSSCFRLNVVFKATERFRPGPMQAAAAAVCSIGYCPSQPQEGSATVQYTQNRISFVRTLLNNVYGYSEIS